MLHESASAIPSSLWSSINSWLTPTVLFLLLNLVIATIAFISNLTHRQHQPHDHLKIARSPSVLHRLKSINFYRSHQDLTNPTSLLKPTADSATHFNANNLETQPQINYFFRQHETPQTEDSYSLQEPQQADDTRFDSDRKGSALDGIHQPHEENNIEDDHEFQSMDEIYSQLKGAQFGRTKSDTEPGASASRGQNPARMKKSASLKSPFSRAEGTAAVEARRPATVRERVLAKVTDSDEEVDAKADDFINKFKQQLKLQRLDSLLRYKDKIRFGRR